MKQMSKLRNQDLVYSEFEKRLILSLAEKIADNLRNERYRLSEIIQSDIARDSRFPRVIDGLTTVEDELRDLIRDAKKPREPAVHADLGLNGT